MLFELQISIYLSFFKDNTETIMNNDLNINEMDPLFRKDETFADANNPINQFETISNENNQNTLDKHRIKNNLDNFAMFRKETHYSTPNFDHPIARDHFKPNVYAKDDNDDKDSRKSFAAKPNEMFEEDSDVFKELIKQNKLIERLANTLLRDDKKAGIQREEFDFQSILDSVEAKKNRTTSSTTTTTTTAKLPTVLTLIDETEVRKALKDDPFVKRILKLAHKKRLNYIEKMG